MARKEPFKRIMVSDRIYDAVDRRRKADSEGEFRPLAMNAYCEKILWDYAQGKMGYLGKDVVDQMQFMVADKKLKNHGGKP